MANYSDGLSDLDLDAYTEFFLAQNKAACFLSVKPQQSFHYVLADEKGLVESVDPIGLGPFYVNGGFFIFKQSVFDFLKAGEDLVEEPFRRLIQAGELITYRNSGFWACMDTLRDKRMLDELHSRGNPPWAVWNRARDSAPAVQAQAGRNGRGNGAIAFDRSNLVGRRRAPELTAGR